MSIDDICNDFDNYREFSKSILEKVDKNYLMDYIKENGMRIREHYCQNMCSYTNNCKIKYNLLTRNNGDFR